MCLIICACSTVWNLTTFFHDVDDPRFDLLLLDEAQIALRDRQGERVRLQKAFQKIAQEKELSLRIMLVTCYGERATHSHR